MDLTADSLFIFGAKYLYMILLVAAVIWILLQPRGRKFDIGVLAVTALPVMYLVALIAGAVYYDPRPFVVGHFTPLVLHDANNGFPSDHTILCAGVSVILSFYNKWVGLALWIMTIVVGCSRVYVGVHHATDILGSIVIALAVGLAAHFVVLPWLRSTKPVRELERILT